MGLPANDMAYLTERGFLHSVCIEANMTCVVVKAFHLPSGYNQSQADLLLRLSPGYPDVAPDMWWFAPPILLTDGRSVKATGSTERHLGQAWQRWSRHFSPGQWRSGTDTLESFLALIRKELERCDTNPTT